MAAAGHAHLTHLFRQAYLYMAQALQPARAQVLSLQHDALADAPREQLVHRSFHV